MFFLSNIWKFSKIYLFFNTILNCKFSNLETFCLLILVLLSFYCYLLSNNLFCFVYKFYISNFHTNLLFHCRLSFRFSFFKIFYIGFFLVYFILLSSGYLFLFLYFLLWLFRFFADFHFFLLVVNKLRLKLVKKVI